MSNNEEWCDYGDMLKVSCEHCIYGVKNAGTKIGIGEPSSRPVADKVGDGKAVPAAFNGICPECRLPIKKNDDWIVRLGTGWAHEECAVEV